MMTTIAKNLPADQQALSARIRQFCAAWSTAGNDPDWATIADIYAQEESFYFDAVTPHSFTNVEGMKVAFFEMRNKLQFLSLTFTLRDDLQTFRRGDLVWTTATHDVLARLPDGQELKLLQRQTSIWEERDGRWVMLHEHLSVPSEL